MFTKILIANRGEIAVRIIRACKEMGIATVAVYSEADRDALHVALADESVCIGPATSAESYLNEERIVSAAMATGAVAIHPGYGFLSENDHFASLCEANDLVFIGAPAKTMQALSDKAKIKSMMQKAGLPIIPGSEPLANVEEAVRLAAEIGYPVMLKARSGGGGRGIRMVTNKEELEQVYHTAVAESLAAFGDGALYLEKCVYPARHVEFQILADEYGNVVCLGERDCSVQLRHQKLIEEGPSPAVTSTMRDALVEKIAAAIREIGYVGLGTLEFLLDKSGHFWFMEMNLRLQVEHGVTEMLCGVDLVKWQIRVASGIPLNFTQEDVQLRGAAIECRINARSVGKVDTLHVPGGPFVRFDTFLIQGGSISPFYDSLLGKLIVWAGDRDEAVRKMRAALCELIIEGVDTNIEEQLALIGEQDFVLGTYDLRFMEGR
ncbi:MAG: acetyl-CoA carboxylase biotin carboxylase subunit [Peptococcaceae bacterium]|nr:acetyl-CoA carboxylase biotin carboxylase subunit [Peptococcaceae bacterium]